MCDVKELLLCGDYTCVVAKGDFLFRSHARGVSPLLELLSTGRDLSNGMAADKVVGKATAFLYLLLGVRELYAGVISRPARALLLRYGVALTYGKCVPYIVNRAGDGRCPFEEAVLYTRTPRAALRAIEEKREELCSAKEKTHNM